MSCLRRIRSIQKFCMQLDEAAQKTIKPFLSQSSYYTPKSQNKRYLDDTFNSILRKQPLIVKPDHRQACKASFCQQMQKLLSKGIWVQNKFRKTNKQRNNEEEIIIKRYQTPTFSNFQISNQRKTSNVKRSEQQQITHFSCNNKNTSQPESVRKSNKTSRVVEQYQQKLRDLQSSNRVIQSRLHNRLNEIQNQNKLLRRSLKKSIKYQTQLNQSQQLKKMSMIREKKIRNLLKEIGVSLKQSSYSKTGFGSTGVDEKQVNYF